LKINYTPEELNNLEQDEFIELAYIPKTDIPYSSILSLGKQNEEYFIELENGKYIYTVSSETFNNIKANKARWDLLSNNFEDLENIKKLQQDLYKKIDTKISTKLENIALGFSASIESMKKSVDKTNEEIKKSFNDIRSSSKSISNIAKNLESNFDEKINKLDKIIEALNSII
jgi:methyl-accepting chemotaxis protein